MNRITEAIIQRMINRRIIGAKHTPEKKLIRSRTISANKEELKQFKKEYKQLLKNKIIIRSKKKTGKGSEWHISLNPRKVDEIWQALIAKHTETR